MKNKKIKIKSKKLIQQLLWDSGVSKTANDKEMKNLKFKISINWRYYSIILTELFFLYYSFYFTNIYEIIQKITPLKRNLSLASVFRVFTELFNFEFRLSKGFTNG